MKFDESVKLSVNNILHRKLRAWLTLLGIVIGVAAVVSIISIGDGAQASVSERLSGFGADLITVSAGNNNASGFFRGLRGGGFQQGGFREGRTTESTASSTTSIPILTKKDTMVIQGNPYILRVNEIVSGSGELIFLAEKSNASIQGVNPTAWSQMSNLELASGRYLSVSDSTAVVIGDRIANGMFAQPVTLGRQITLEGKAFTVSGILKPSGTGFGGGSDSTVYMTHNSAWGITDINKDTYSSIQAQVSDSELAEEATQTMTESLRLSRRVTERNQDFSITSAQAVQEQVSAVTQTLTLFLAAIAAVSLIVGAIGIANSMYTSVLEKTKEIGILKALGSTNNEILRLFMIESGLFGFIGGIIGVILGTAIAAGISVIAGPTFSTVVTPELLIFAVVLSTIIGIVAGAMPAKSASQLKPVEALRYE